MPNQSKSDRPAPTDWFLERLIQVVATSGVTIGITLNVGGTIVTGDMIKSTQYFDELTRQLKAGPLMRNTESDTDDHIETEFIHLKNAHIMDAAGDAFPRRGTLWRGRLATVDGFMFGKPKH
jgi:hypothetical protein